ncbi:GNAT family N-acetyltransferase [Ketogulonicigenium robustum]|uniref:GNAT family N-acetyltransferase n=1 Tax=Ketogulonicigenium robustum TaxID=92947 RepID=UPI001EED432E|nr:GNAT family N-acetyltransferase [Ketogulonicigenium robustum]
MRQLVAADAVAFRRLRLAGLRAHPTAFGADFAYESRQQLDFFSARLTNGTVYGVFTRDGTLAAIGGVYADTGQKTAHISTIWGIYVSPEHRGKGAADALMAALIANRAARCQQIRLSVAADNATALRLYQRHGFRIWARDHGALLVDGRLYDEILMRRDFDNTPPNP